MRVKQQSKCYKKITIELETEREAQLLTYILETEQEARLLTYIVDCAFVKSLQEYAKEYDIEAKDLREFIDDLWKKLSPLTKVCK